MSSRRRLAPVVLAALVVSTGGCKLLRKGDGAIDSGTTGAEIATVGSAAIAETTPDGGPDAAVSFLDLDRFARPSDDEVQAKKEIDRSNYKTELDKLEKEIAAEK